MSLEGYSPWSCKVSDTTEQLTLFSILGTGVNKTYEVSALMEFALS